jgi:hypothetical protein
VSPCRITFRKGPPTPSIPGQVHGRSVPDAAVSRRATQTIRNLPTCAGVAMSVFKGGSKSGQGRVLSYFVLMGCNICCHIAPYPYFADSETLNQTLLRVRCASFLCANSDETLLEGRAKAQTDCNRSREIRVLKPRRRRGDPPREIARHLVNSVLGLFSVIFLKPALFGAPES